MTKSTLDSYEYRLQEFYYELKNQNCCPRCILRYLPLEEPLMKPYENPTEFFIFLNLEFPFIKTEFEPDTKKRKLLPCSVCVGFLSDEILNEFLNHMELINVKKSPEKCFGIRVTHPKCVHIRDRSMQMHLKNKFGSFFKTDDLISLPKVWRFAVQDRIARTLGKEHYVHAKLCILSTVSYTQDADEVAKLCPNSKQELLNFITQLTDEQFAQVVKVPPSLPTGESTLNSVCTQSAHIILIGRYVKYSRHLLQVPYTVHNQTYVEHSIQTSIFNAVKAVVGATQKIVFKTAGRDIINSRVLGNGKHFVLEIAHPFKSSLTEDNCEAIKQLANVTNSFRVKKLNVSFKEESVGVIELEKEARKVYQILCTIEEPKKVANAISTVNSINGDILVGQKVAMARRITAYFKRIRKVYSMEASAVGSFPNAIVLKVTCEAGLCIDCFLHGDLGRTKPSLNKIINCHVCVVGLDLLTN